MDPILAKMSSQIRHHLGEYFSTNEIDTVYLASQAYVTRISWFPAHRTGSIRPDALHSAARLHFVLSMHKWCSRRASQLDFKFTSNYNKTSFKKTVSHIVVVVYMEIGVYKVNNQKSKEATDPTSRQFEVTQEITQTPLKYDNSSLPLHLCQHRQFYNIGTDSKNTTLSIHVLLIFNFGTPAISVQHKYWKPLSIKWYFWSYLFSATWADIFA